MNQTERVEYYETLARRHGVKRVLRLLVEMIDDGKQRTQKTAAATAIAGRVK